MDANGETATEGVLPRIGRMGLAGLGMKDERGTARILLRRGFHLRNANGGYDGGQADAGAPYRGADGSPGIRRRHDYAGQADTPYQFPCSG